MITITQSGSAITEEIKVAYEITLKTIVVEYSLALFNPQSGDYQDNLAAAFSCTPSKQDWDNWLSGWTSCGYSLSSNPILVNSFVQPSY
jgi:hypothetical protein